MSIRKTFDNLINPFRSGETRPLEADEEAAEQLWQATYHARQRYFEAEIGPFPNDILKMLNMTGVWPGGGLFVVPAPKLGHNLSAYTTFGFSNPDMPATVRVSDFSLESDEHGVSRGSSTLSAKQPMPKKAGASGYGYELLVVTESDEEWPLNLLQWAVHAEIGNDIDLLGRVEECDGLTAERIQVGPTDFANILIAKAQPPIPAGTDLPDGHMDVLVATIITRAEMEWSQEYGRGELLERLMQAGVGQVSFPDRESVVK